MRIIEANNLKYKDVILDLIIKHIKKLDWTKQQLEAWLKINLGTDIFGAWLVLDEQKRDEPVGVLTCEIVEQEVLPRVFISFCYVRPDLDYCSELLERCENWAKEKRIEKLFFYTKRSYRTFEKKYGFKLERTTLSKELKI